MKVAPILVLVVVVALVNAAGVALSLNAFSFGGGPPCRGGPGPVLIATRFIPTGTPYERIVPQRMYTSGWLPTTGRGAWAEYTLQEGAILNPAYVSGRVTIVDINAGQVIENKLFGP